MLFNDKLVSQLLESQQQEITTLKKALAAQETALLEMGKQIAGSDIVKYEKRLFDLELWKSQIVDLITQTDKRKNTKLTPFARRHLI